MNLAIDWLHRRSQYSPDKIALIDTITDRRITYKEWNAQANQTVHYMHEDLGIGIGDRVAILSSNLVEYLDVIFACNKLGAVCLNLNYRLSDQELLKLIDYGQPKTVFYSAEFKEMVNTLKASCEADVPESWVAFEDKAEDNDQHISLREQHPDTWNAFPEFSDETPWIICYTGGTTGLPKGVMLTYKMLTWNAINTMTGWNLDFNDTAILNSPLFHVSGVSITTTPMVYLGGTSIVCKAFDIEETFDLLDRENITTFCGVPTVFNMMRNHPRFKTTKLSNLKWIGAGGSPCPDTVLDAFWEKNKNFGMGYGLTEAGPNNFAMPREQRQIKKTSVGYPMPFADIRLMNEDDEFITRPNEVGQIVIRGPHCTPGYWGNITATTQAIDGEGWLHTQDLARFDEDGAFTICGRMSDFFISGGENIYPLDIESIIYLIPEVTEVAVFGVPDTKWGEIGCAVIALKHGATLSASYIKSFLDGKIAKFKIPHHYIFVTELEKTGAGKINKKSMQQKYSIIGK